MACKAVIFDLDGTLIDSIRDLWLSTNYALVQCALPQRTLDEVRCFVGNGVEMLIRRAVPEGTEEALTARCLDYFRQHYVDHCRDHTAPYEGVMAMLRALQHQGIRTAICSNKLQAGVDSLCDRFFAGLADVAVGERPQVRRKPAPDMLVEAMRQLGVRPSETVYVGDSDVDIETARAAGVRCVSVTWGFRSSEFLLAHGAVLLATRPEEVEGMLMYG